MGAADRDVHWSVGLGSVGFRRRHDDEVPAEPFAMGRFRAVVEGGPDVGITVPELVELIQDVGWYLRSIRLIGRVAMETRGVVL